MTTGLQMLIGDAAPLLAALLLGHFLADFAFQSRRMVQRKRTVSGSLMHGLVVFAVHVAAYLPFLDARALVALLGLSIVHVIIDRLKIAYESRRGPSLAAFLVDQTAHVLLLVPIALYFAYHPSDAPLSFVWPLRWEPFIRFALIVAGGAFLWTGGSALVRHALVRTRITIDDDGSPAAGHAIGVLERLIVYLFVLAGQWAAAGLVIAAKSLARFEDLKERPFAEYYLVGTLASVLVAAAVGFVVGALL